jgi:pSer/pThr/pTyr-binding forkhead associated (FHA) protein
VEGSTTMTAQRTERWTFTGPDALPGPTSPLPRDTATVTVTRGPLLAAPHTVPITSATVTIGRHPGCDIVLDDITVSRTHAELRRTGDGITITDLGSLNGTYVNREPVDLARLADGDTIWIGKYRLVFRAGADVTAPEPALAGAR